VLHTFISPTLLHVLLFATGRSRAGNGCDLGRAGSVALGTEKLMVPCFILSPCPSTPNRHPHSSHSPPLPPHLPMHDHDIHFPVIQGFVKDRRTAVGRFPAACVEVLDGSADATSPGHRHQSSAAAMSPRATGSSFDFKCVGIQRTDSWLSHDAV
jgi:hypothetical protein